MLTPWPPGPDAPATFWAEIVVNAPRKRYVIDPTVSAVHALAGAAEADPLRAVVDAVEAAGWSEQDEKAWFTAVRAELARLRG